MRANYCPSCGEEISASDMVLEEKIVACSHCGERVSLREVAVWSMQLERLLADAPAGCSLQKRGGERGRELRITISLRSRGAFFGHLFVSLFWNSITLLFLLIALGSLYQFYVEEVPEWFPFLSDQEPKSLWQSLVWMVFLTPFVLIGCFLWWRTLLSFAGKTEVFLGRNRARLFEGIGWIGYGRSFEQSDIRDVGQTMSRLTINGERLHFLTLEGKKRIRFLSLMNDEQLAWAIFVLKLLLNQRTHSAARRYLFELISLARN